MCVLLEHMYCTNVYLIHEEPEEGKRCPVMNGLKTVMSTIWVLGIKLASLQEQPVLNW